MPRPLMAYFGQHKSGSNWIHQITGKLARKAGLRYERYTRPTEFDRDLAAHVETNRVDCVSWVNAEWTLVKDVEFKAFHVVRDPRDILVSAYFSHLKTHPTENWPRLAEFRPKLQAVSKEEGIMMEFDFIRDVFRRFRDWEVGDPRVIQFRLEDISQDYISHFRQAYEFIGLFDRGLKDRHFLEVMEEMSFEKMSGGRKKGEENKDSHYRKGVHGDWQNHLTPEHIAYFKQEHNDLLVKYGYEKDANW
ncbi:MAG: sulfotransferase domain-containing protein [Candidatus Hydrogenedentes bacterium]|nr:sulfotransferase domain-containing protein [Candidatus Hydrogenedentota bacterium]